MYRSLFTSLAVIASLTSTGVVHAQASNGLDQNSPTPVLIAPLTAQVTIGEATPTFEFNAVSNADQYRLVVRIDPIADRGNFVFQNYRFSSGAATGGVNVVDDASGVVVCENATIGACDFTPANLTLADGDRFVYLLGTRNLDVGQTVWQYAPAQRLRFFEFPAASQTLSANDLFAPRGNISGDAGADRAAAAGPIAFHWMNNSDASSFTLVMSTNPEGNLLTEQSFPISAARCETTSGLFDACTFMFDPEAVINNAADDFCWTVVPQNQRDTTPAIDPNAVACYAAE